MSRLVLKCIHDEISQKCLKFERMAHESLLTKLFLGPLRRASGQKQAGFCLELLIFPKITYLGVYSGIPKGFPKVDSRTNVRKITFGFSQLLGNDNYFAESDLETSKSIHLCHNYSQNLHPINWVFLSKENLSPFSLV